MRHSDLCTLLSIALVALVVAARGDEPAVKGHNYDTVQVDATASDVANDGTLVDIPADTHTDVADTVQTDTKTGDTALDEDTLTDTLADTVQDTVADVNQDTTPVCGNGLLESTEVCDTDTFATTCSAEGFFAGVLHCSADCTAFDTSTCTNCGNGSCDAGEESTSCSADCPNCSLPGVGDLVLNELLYDPAPGTGLPFQTNGDANCDGTRGSAADEFIELLNVNAAAIDLTGVQVVVDGASKLGIPAGTCLQPRQALVIFGASTANPACAEFADAVFMTAPLGLGNTGGAVVVTNAANVPFTRGSLAWVNLQASDTSLVRDPELTGSAFLPFNTVVADGRRQSPATCNTGAPFATCP